MKLYLYCFALLVFGLVMTWFFHRDQFVFAAISCSSVFVWFVVNSEASKKTKRKKVSSMAAKLGRRIKETGG